MSDNVLNNFTPAIEAEAIDTSRKLKIGIIGTGWIAESHIESYKMMPDVEIVAAADLIDGKAEAFMKRYGVEGVRFYHDHKELIDNEPDLDAVSVCTYNTQHAIPTIYALEHGVNVLLEKPFTVTLDEAVEVMRAEKKSGKILSIGFQPRGDENMKMIKKIVESGALGEIYYIQTGGGRRRGIPNSTFIEKETGGIGALGDIGCYSLDMVLNAIGYPKPLTVTGYTSNFFGTEPGDTIIMGKKGSLRIPSTECWNGSVGGEMTVYTDVAGAQTEMKIPIIGSGDDYNGLFYKKIRSFLDAIKKGLPAPVPTSQILYNQAIIDGICKSAELGHEIKIEIPEI